ncbi:unnamed protein product [Allacma fusca]|uniref:Uncharacterized protein n=1 Tax=Allacma fusca TaxID=39272 RepID=A0A8J2KVR8_9HEXA|nr:unnamed protein product [Allacma fusca]
MEHAHCISHAQCEEDVARQRLLVMASFDACTGAGDPCPAQCTVVQQGATDGGVLTGASFGREARRRLEPEISWVLEEMMSYCLDHYGGQLTPNSQCYEWTDMGVCFEFSSRSACDGFSFY